MGQREYFFACKIRSKWNDFFTFNGKILYFTIPIVFRKNLSQSDHTDCNIIKIEGKEKKIWLKYLDYCQCFEIQYILGG